MKEQSVRRVIEGERNKGIIVNNIKVYQEEKWKGQYPKIVSNVK